MLRERNGVLDRRKEPVEGGLEVMKDAGHHHGQEDEHYDQSQSRK